MSNEVIASHPDSLPEEQEEPFFPFLAQLAGAVRGELSIKDLSETMLERIELNAEIVEEFRERYEPKYVGLIVPKSHHEHSLHDLKPYQLGSMPKVPLDEQRHYISRASNFDPNALRGWLLMGPGGTGKTTYVSAWITDRITLRQVNRTEYVLNNRHPGMQELCIWRLKLKSWFDAQAAWKTRDLSKRTYRLDGELDTGPVTPAEIEAACDATGTSPILWLEEIDKFVPNDNRLAEIHTLIDAVYEKRGLLIVTTNKTHAELRKMLPYETWRRINGDDDPREEFVQWNLHRFSGQ